VVPRDDTLRAKMGSILFPIVRQDMMTSFQSEWEAWFVLEDTIEEKRAPGKLKSKMFYYSA